MLRFGRKRLKPSIITLADRARDARQWEVAAGYYRDALYRRPENAPIWVQYGHVLKESGRLPEAERAYRIAVAYDTSVADSHLQLARILKIQGKREEARAAYLQAIALGCSLNDAAMEFTQFGWSEVHFSQLRDMLPSDSAGNGVASASSQTSPKLVHAAGLHSRTHDNQDPVAPKYMNIALTKHHDLINQMKTISCEFNREYYLSCYPDINPAVVDPLEHFCTTGWKEGRNPCEWFSTGYYLNIHWDVADAGINPFAHYLTQGRQEGRQIAGVIRDLKLDPKASLVSDELLFDYVRFPSRPIMTDEKSFDPQMMRIHWVIPDFGVGQGGHMTIFRIVRWLEIFGHRCTIWINHPSNHNNSSRAFEDIVKSYQPIASDLHFVSDGFSDASGDAVIATAWHTVQIVSHAQRFKDRFYFVQDYEPDFYPRGAQSILAESTYRKDLACICCGTWLEGVMRERYGRWARHFWLAPDESSYFQSSQPGSPNRVPRIAFYCRVYTARRAVELAFLALEHLASQGVPFHVDLFGEQLAIYRAPFPCTLHGVLNSEELGELYRAADLGLCFSTTNYSIVPQEMMACGLPVVEIDVESTRAIFPDSVITFCGPQPLEIANAIGTFLREPDRRRRQAEAAAAWVSSFSWEQSARLVEAALRDRLAESGYKYPTTVISSGSPLASIKVSVFIPTYNGGEVFKAVVEMVRRQRSPWQFEIIVIDSSSDDQTADFCHGANDIVFEQIAKSEFSHGGTRNRGVELAQGEFVAFLTQDALPIDEFWLYNLVSLLEAYPNAAGAFGRHVAWPDASPFVKRDLAEHFKQFDAAPIAVSIETDAGRWASGDSGWRQFLHFYSDNNSCLRRSVWKNIPLPDVSYGEDQLWAYQIIKAGYEKIYVRSATVYHSHDYDYYAMRGRSEEEAVFFKLNFGYDLIDVRKNLELALAERNQSDSHWAHRYGVSDAELRKRRHLNRAHLEGYYSGYWKCAHSGTRQS